MSGQLRHVAFTPEMVSRPGVQAFDCGVEEWETEIATWLKAPASEAGASDDVTIAGNLVWLYVSSEGELVGVGSVGNSTASWPKNSNPRLDATCTTWLAVDVKQRGKGYGQQILDHLLGEALQKAEVSPLVVLYVHTSNQQARDWYGNRTNNFVPVGSVVVRNGRPYQRMVLSLTQSPPETPVSN